MLAYHRIAYLYVIFLILSAGGAFARDDGVNQRQREISLNFLNRSQTMKLFNIMLEEAAFQIGEEQVLENGQDCQQRVCTNYFLTKRTYKRAGQSLDVSIGVGIRERSEHSFFWDMDLENRRSLSPVYVSYVIDQQLGGTDIAASLISSIQQNRPELIADSEFRGIGDLYVALRELECTGPRNLGNQRDAQCSYLTLDGERFEISGLDAYIAFEGLHDSSMTGPGIHMGREVVAVGSDQMQIRIVNAICEYRPIESGYPPGGHCLFYRLK